MTSLSIDIRCQEQLPELDYQSLAALTYKICKLEINKEISLSFCSAEEIQKLNCQYRAKDYVTDVLSFPAAIDGVDLPVLGDIVICAAQAEKQAEELGHSLERELAFLFVHGLLHLLGYDHEVSEDEERIMFDLQDQVLVAANIART